MWETEGPLVFNGTYNPDFTLELHCKDLNLGYDLARKFKVPTELHSHVEQIYNRARFRYGNDAGSSYPLKMLEDDLQEQLQIGGTGLTRLNTSIIRWRLFTQQKIRFMIKQKTDYFGSESLVCYNSLVRLG